MACTQPSASEHLSGAGFTFFTHKGKAVARGGTVKGQHTAVAEGLKGAGKRGFTCVGHGVIEITTGRGFGGFDKVDTGVFPGCPLRWIIGYRGEGRCPLRIFSVDSSAADGFDPLGALGTRDHARHTQTAANGTAQTVVARAGRGAFDEQPLARLDIEGVIEGAVDGAQRESVGTRFLNAETG